MAKKEEKGTVSKSESVDVSKLVSGLVAEYRKKNMLIETGRIECDFFDSGNLALNYILSGKFDEGFPTGQVINVHGDPQCLIAGTKVVLSNGAIVDIESLGKVHLEHINVGMLRDGLGNAENARVFHCYKNQDVIEVETQSGRRIVGTYDHPLLKVGIRTANHGRRKLTRIEEWAYLSELKVGDYIKVVTYIPCSIDNLVSTKFVPIQIKGFSYKGQVPQYVSEELAAVFGYVIGDGWIRTKHNRGIGFVVAPEEIDVLPVLLRYMDKLFGVKPQIDKKIPKTPWNNKQELTYVTYSNVYINHMLRFLIDKRVPDLIFRSGNKVVASFLRWLFEADGTVFCNGRARRSIALKSINTKLLEDVQLLLLRFGIESRIGRYRGKGNNLLIRQGESIAKFNKFVGFASRKKQTRSCALMKYIDGRRTNKIKDYDKVRSIKRLDVKSDVYDVELPLAHQFVANGIISHNTGKSLLVCNAIANFLKKYPDGVAILDDTEFAYVEYLGSNLGIDESRFIRLNTSTVEEHSKAVFFGGKIKTMDVDTGKDVEVEVEPIVPKLWNKGCKHILIAVDSIAMWSTEHELAIVGLDKPDMGKAKVLRALLRTIMPEVKKYGLTYIITNHLIFNIGDMFGPRKIEGGGQAPAYQSSIRLCMQIAGKIKVDSKGKSGELGGDKDDKNAKIVGVVARATTVKNRFAPPFRNCLIDIKFDAGMSRFSGLLKLLQDLSIVSLAPGGWYETCDKKIKFQSKDFETKWPEIKALITPDKVKMRESESPIVVEDIKDEE